MADPTDQLVVLGRVRVRVGRDLDAVAQEIAELQAQPERAWLLGLRVQNARGRRRADGVELEERGRTVVRGDLRQSQVYAVENARRRLRGILVGDPERGAHGRDVEIGDVAEASLDAPPARVAVRVDRQGRSVRTEDRAGDLVAPIAGTGRRLPIDLPGLVVLLHLRKHGKYVSVIVGYRSRAALGRDGAVVSGHLSEIEAQLEDLVRRYAVLRAHLEGVAPAVHESPVSEDVPLVRALAEGLLRLFDRQALPRARPGSRQGAAGARQVDPCSAHGREDRLAIHVGPRLCQGRPIAEDVRVRPALQVREVLRRRVDLAPVRVVPRAGGTGGRGGERLRRTVLASADADHAEQTDDAERSHRHEPWRRWQSLATSTAADKIVGNDGRCANAGSCGRGPTHGVPFGPHAPLAVGGGGALFGSGG